MSKCLRLYFWTLNKAGLHTLIVAPVENKPGTIFFSNHTSKLDALYYMAVFPEICAIVKSNIFYISPFGLICFSAGYITNNPRENAVKKAISILRSGQSIFIFPEGTREKKGQNVQVKRGASMIALRSGSPMFFCHIDQSEEILGKDTPFLHVPKEPIVTRLSFHKIPPDILRVRQDETPWIASRRITKSLENVLKHPENSHSP